MKLILYLGCWGRENEGFCFCKGVQNRILDLSKPSEINTKIIDYVDNSLKLFDKPLYNNVHTAIFNINEKFSEKIKPIFSDLFFKRMEEFCIFHTKCGLYLRLDLEENEA